MHLRKVRADEKGNMLRADHYRLETWICLDDGEALLGCRRQTKRSAFWEGKGIANAEWPSRSTDIKCWMTLRTKNNSIPESTSKPIGRP